MKILLPAIGLLLLVSHSIADETPAQPKNASEMTSSKEIHARFLPGNELWKQQGVVRIYTERRDFTILTPLNVKVWVFDAKGETLPSKPGALSVDWMAQIPGETMVRGGVVAEIRVQTYTGLTEGLLQTNLSQFDTKKIGSVWITFSVQFEKGKNEQVAVQIPMSVVLHPPAEL